MPSKIGLRDDVIQAADDLDFFRQAQALHFEGGLILEIPPAPSHVVSRDRDFVERVFGS